MKYRVLAYSALVLGVVALTSSFAEPIVSAQASTTASATVAITCRGTGDLFVNYTYSGFSGAVHGVDFHVGKVGDTVITVKGGSGVVVQAFNQSAAGTPVAWGTVGAELVSHAGKVIAGSTNVWGAGTLVTC